MFGIPVHQDSERHPAFLSTSEHEELHTRRPLICLKIYIPHRRGTRETLSKKNTIETRLTKRIESTVEPFLCINPEMSQPQSLSPLDTSWPAVVQLSGRRYLHIRECYPTSPPATYSTDMAVPFPRLETLCTYVSKATLHPTAVASLGVARCPGTWVALRCEYSMYVI